MADGTKQLRFLYPPIEPYAQDWLQTMDGHRIYVEQSGNPEGIPILFIHGGPGGGTGPTQRRFFDPEKFRIILFDQRGCGQSRPHASLDHNTSWHLMSDMELIRSRLGIKRWALFGGSWGSTLALIYAINHPQRVRHIILRGIFLMTQRELDWFYGYGTSAIFPDAWDEFVKPIPKAERGDLVKAYYRRLTETEFADNRLHFARHWSNWESRTVTLVPEVREPILMDPTFALAFARIEAHYFVNKGFLPCDNYILDHVHLLQHIPTNIIHSRYDAICPPVSAFELAKAMPWASLQIVPVAGHSAFEAPVAHELITATDNL